MYDKINTIDRPSALITTEFTTNDTNHHTFAEQITKISSNIETIKNQIHKLVDENYELLFQQTFNLNDINQDLLSIKCESSKILQTLNLIQSKFLQQYQQLIHEIQLLSRLQKTCDLSRKMLRIIYLIERCDELNLDQKRKLSNNQYQSIYLKELIKLSQYINEIDNILLTSLENDGQQPLKRLNCIEKYLEKYEQFKQFILNETENILNAGLQMMDSNLLTTSLQIYTNLQMLSAKFQQLLDENYSNIEKSLAKLYQIDDLNSNRIQIAISVKQTNLMKTSIRSNVKEILENFLKNFQQILLIIKIMKRRRDNQTQMLLIEFIQPNNNDGDDDNSIIENFWTKIHNLFTEKFNNFYDKSSKVIQNIIISDYTKLLSIFNDYQTAIDNEIESNEIFKSNPLRMAIQKYENLFLTNSLTLLFDVVNKIFMNSSMTNGSSSSSKIVIDSIPSEKDIDNIIISIQNEIQQTMFDRKLLESIGKNLFKTIDLFIIKCEQLISTDMDATQIIGKFTINQRHNALLITQLNYFDKKLRQLFKISFKNNDLNNDNDYVDIVCEQIKTYATKSIDTLVLNIFEPFILSIQSSIEDIILTVHDEKYDIQSEISQGQCSLYMKELQRFIQRISRDYFQQYPQDSKIIADRIHKMSAYVIDYFLLQNCLIRPINQNGRRKILNDFIQLEEIILPICNRLGELGHSYQQLKAFKMILMLKPEEIVESPLINDPIPIELIIQFFISNHTTRELKLPYEYRDISISRYSEWYIRSSSDEHMNLIRETINEYVGYAKKLQMKQYFSTYHLLMNLMAKMNVFK